MTQVELPHWERQHWEPDGGEPYLFYKLHGDFSNVPAVSRSKYRCEGPPDGVEIHVLTADDDADAFAFGRDVVFSARLRAEHPAVALAVDAAPQAMIIRGPVADTGDLDYFRDTVGLIMAMLDGGGVAVFDPFKLDWWTKDEWRTRAFDPGGAVPRHHAVILVSDDEHHAGKKWIHTRGMLKFGRPDLSIRGLTADDLPVFEDVCNRFIEMLAFGAVIPEGQPLRMKSLTGSWACFHGGDHDDPDFNNVHVEIRRVE